MCYLKTHAHVYMYAHTRVCVCMHLQITFFYSVTSFKSQVYIDKIKMTDIQLAFLFMNYLQDMQYLAAWTQEIYLPSPKTWHATEWHPLKDPSLLEPLVVILGGCKELPYQSSLCLITERIHQENSSFQFSCSIVSDFLQPHGLQHGRPPSPTPTSKVYANSCPLSL